MKKTDKTPLLGASKTQQKIGEIERDTRELKDQLNDVIGKALQHDKDMLKLRKSAKLLKDNSRRFYKKSRQIRLSQMGCCAYSFALLKEFFSALLQCLQKLCCCIRTDDSSYNNHSYT
jgi:hypothetical protein